jgi:translation initiation factor eIF-2B subunit delta
MVFKFTRRKWEIDSNFFALFRFENSNVHPAFLKLGLQYASGHVSGSNSRCIKFLVAFKDFIRDYKLPKDHRDINKDLETKLKPNIK